MSNEHDPAGAAARDAIRALLELRSVVNRTPDNGCRSITIRAALMRALEAEFPGRTPTKAMERLKEALAALPERTEDKNVTAPKYEPMF